MRRRLAVALILLAAIGPWVWFLPKNPSTEALAELVSVTSVPRQDPRVGGLSGIEVSQDGKSFTAVTDRGHIVTGVLERTASEISGVALSDIKALRDKNGNTRDFPHTDAEGLALDARGRIYVSFEHAHRILFYEKPGGTAQWPSYTRSWRALTGNSGLEAVAVSKDGTLYTVPEEIQAGASEALVYRRTPNTAWEQPFTVPVDKGFAPVGADFGPDGRLYLLERGIYPFGFFSRVRAMDITDEGAQNIETILQTRLGKHGNLEGLSVWRDEAGQTRLTMVSDDNFYWFMRGQIVEYVLKAGLARR
ncbi:MAG: esterase-like activity of phytase family protein [Pseudomonadota bacterium]